MEPAWTCTPRTPNQHRGMWKEPIISILSWSVQLLCVSQHLPCWNALEQVSKVIHPSSSVQSCRRRRAQADRNFPCSDRYGFPWCRYSPCDARRPLRTNPAGSWAGSHLDVCVKVFASRLQSGCVQTAVTQSCLMNGRKWSRHDKPEQMNSKNKHHPRGWIIVRLQQVHGPDACTCCAHPAESNVWFHSCRGSVSWLERQMVSPSAHQPPRGAHGAYVCLHVCAWLEGKGEDRARLGGTPRNARAHNRGPRCTGKRLKSFPVSNSASSARRGLSFSPLRSFIYIPLFSNPLSVEGGRLKVCWWRRVFSRRAVAIRSWGILMHLSRSPTRFLVLTPRRMTDVIDRLGLRTISVEFERRPHISGRKSLFKIQSLVKVTLGDIIGEEGLNI